MSEYTLKSLPDAERPRERLRFFGADAVSTSELIAIIIGSGTRGCSVLQLAQQLLQRFGSLTSLAEATIEELIQVKGLGIAKATQLKAALSLGTRLVPLDEEGPKRLERPEQVFGLLKSEFQVYKQEVFCVLLLDAKGKLIKKEHVSLGTLTQALVHPREVFYPAIRHKAASLILAHNHPSGDPSPSSEDLEVTSRLVEAGRQIGIPIHDHVIIGRDGYVSLRERGVKFQ